MVQYDLIVGPDICLTPDTNGISPVNIVTPTGAANSLTRHHKVVLTTFKLF